MEVHGFPATKELERISHMIDSIPLDRDAISQKELDLTDKNRSNLFNWRGQFSPQLIEHLLEKYGNPGMNILDPFMGSGTVIFEGIKKRMNVFGTEINPSAYEMATTAYFAKLTLRERREFVAEAKHVLLSWIAETKGNPRYFSKLIDQLKGRELLLGLVENTLFRYSKITKTDLGGNEYLKSFNIQANIALGLPLHDGECQLFLNDARSIPLKDKSIDLVITSPPYINVFNYHQNYRHIMEASGYDVLKIAQSEIGSNRRNRSNRFFTVVQYSIDMMQVLLEIRRVLRDDGRIIIVVGRTSSVRGVSYPNFKIISMIAFLGGGLRLVQRQERGYTNRFGETIYEDLLHFEKDGKLPDDPTLCARSVAVWILRDSLTNAPHDRISEIESAIKEAKVISGSPLLNLKKEEITVLNLPTPHKDKLLKAIENPKCSDTDRGILRDAVSKYEDWISRMWNLKSMGKQRVQEMVRLLNEYKDYLEIELLMKRGSPFLKRQKGQLKLDNSVLEEFFIHLVRPDIITGLSNMDKLVVGPQNAFMSLAFFPKSVNEISSKPSVVVKTKDQDFVIGAKIHYKFSPNSDFPYNLTESGEFLMAVLSAEIKVNLDKTMFQEAAGTASRLKQGVPVARYFMLIEYVDMSPEDTRLTAIDNVFVLRNARRLPFEKRDILEEVVKQHREHPINDEVIWRFVTEIQLFIDSVLYDPDRALERGSFN